MQRGLFGISQMESGERIRADRLDRREPCTVPRAYIMTFKTPYRPARCVNSLDGEMRTWTFVGALFSLIPKAI